MRDENKTKEQLIAELAQVREVVDSLRAASATSEEGQLALIEERDQLISLIEHSSEAISIVTPGGAYSYMNPAGLRMVGLESLQELIGKPIHELHPTIEHQRLASEILPAVRKGRWQGELVYENLTSGALVPCWTNAFAVTNSQTGELIGLAALSHDVSASKSAERHRERLHGLNEVSRRVATSLLEQDDLSRAIGIILAGVGRILGVARAHLCRFREDRRWIFRTHQWNAGEAEAGRVELQPESAELHGELIGILLRGEAIRVDDIRRSSLRPSTEGSVLRPDVTALLVLPVIIHGRLESFFGFVRTDGPRVWKEEEVSILQIIVESFARAVERRIAERERMMIARDLERAVSRERRANRYKSEFLANMSHELRTPMNAIVGYAELLGRPNVDAQKQSVWVANIRRSTDHLLSLINDILDLSKIEAGQMTIKTEPCNLREMIAEVEGLLRVNAEEALLEFSVVYRNPVPATIETDPVRFRQILINLVGNALKFTKAGSVTIQVDVQGTERDEEQVLLVAVEDTGIGIDEEALGRLFRPFYQAHGRQDPRFRGTGLGLDISRHLARLLGGEILVRSKVGHGSCFTLRLALKPGAVLHTAPVPPTEEAEERQQGRFLAGARILIVDDSAENREVMRFLLSEAGCGSEPAENGALGVKIAVEARDRGRPFDAILMDVNMPVMDGLEATAELRHLGVESPIIALTALAMEEDQQRCLEAGCVDYISKPVVPSRFFDTIARHFRQGAAGAAPAATNGPPAAPDAAVAGDPAAAVFSLVGNPRFEPLIRRYVDSFREVAERIREDREAGRIDDVRTRVHRLRGTATNYGFPEVSEMAGRCEDAIRRGDEEAGLERSLARLLDLLEQDRG